MAGQVLRGYGKVLAWLIGHGKAGLHADDCGIPGGVVYGYNLCRVGWRLAGRVCLSGGLSHRLAYLVDDVACEVVLILRQRQYPQARHEGVFKLGIDFGWEPMPAVIAGELGEFGRDVGKQGLPRLRVLKHPRQRRCQGGMGIAHGQGKDLPGFGHRVKEMLVHLSLIHI